MDIPKSLLERIDSNKVVVFVGAGLSRSVGYPGWGELVNRILDEIKDIEPKSLKYQDALKDEIMTPLDVLNKIEKYKEQAIEALDKIIRAFDGQRPSKVHAKIGEISTKIITTNYDCLLEEQFPSFEKISYSNNFKIAKLSEYDSYIFKIHGDIHEPDKCILFPFQYNDLYGDSIASSVFELKKIISDKSLLFIGFSLSDPYIENVFEFVSSIYKGFTPDHYIITTEYGGIWPSRVAPIVIASYNELETLLDEIISKTNVTGKGRKSLVSKIKIEGEDAVGIAEMIESDLPPQNKYWVGREKELENISSPIFKVIFITGIGGQGKSALAARYLNNRFDSELYEYGDWRDFKEETNRFQTKLISIIERVSVSGISAKQLDNSSNEELVDVFFSCLGQKKIVFVFDNIDSYIDLETFTPSGGLKYFFEQSLAKSHNSKFIFTCRPFIREASVNFYQLKLSGLSEAESIEMFSLYEISLKEHELVELARKAYSLTKGHPLWLNLIAAQALRGVGTVNKFIRRIEDKTDFDEDDFSSILSEKILNEVWCSLNEKQKILLRSIAESVKAETVSNLKKIIESELKNNQFNKAFKVLKNLNLVEIKSSRSHTEDKIELHPLVKEFIVSKFPPHERAKYITLLVRYYDKFIYVLKPQLSSAMSLSSFQNWTSKIELQLNQGDFTSALIALEEVSSSILSAGFTEEYLRVSEKLFHGINWSEAIGSEFLYFDSQFSTLATTLTQFGRFAKCEDFLNHYSEVIPGKGMQYLSFCSEKCYLFWMQGKFTEAIDIGEYGLFLLDESGVADRYTLRHNLALAWRDSNDPFYLEKALNHFLKGEKIEEIVEKSDKDLGGHFYGNIGKCLELMGDIDLALTCYYISIGILFKEDNSHAKLNIGYAASWIFNLLKSGNQKLNALYFLKLSIDSWSHCSPPRAEKVKKEWENFPIDMQTKQAVNKIPDWKIIVNCKEIAGQGKAK